MNIFDISEKAKVSVKALRRLDKLGVLRHDESTTELDGIRATIKMGNRLNVGQLVYLVENAGALLELGKYASKAEIQLAELDKPATQVAPREVAAQILAAFEKEPEAVAEIVRWLKTVIPSHPVGHSYVAARLLLGVPVANRVHDIPRLQRVMMNCRDDPTFAGWWRKERGVSQSKTIYQKPTLDL